MDPSVRQAHNEDRRVQESLYEKEGYIGEGAFGVVRKACLRQNNNNALLMMQTEMEGEGEKPATSTNAVASSSVAAASSSASASSSSSKQYVAIKEMMNQREGQGIPQDAYREIKILKELKHENIVSLERIFTRPDKHEIDLVYEYAEHDLAEIIKYNRQKVTNQSQYPDARFVKSVLYQILSGLAFLHKNWCMHRDMKPANILISSSSSSAAPSLPPTSANAAPSYCVKIADFGLARIFQSPLRKLSDDGEVVTIWYRAPELLLGSKHYTRAIDVFAVGCIFYEIMTCQPLFPGVEIPGQKVFQENQVKEVFRVLGKPTLDQWKGMADCPHYAAIKNWNPKDYTYTLNDRLRHVSPNARHLLGQLLLFDPALRITAEAALNHPYFKNEEPKPDRNVFRDTAGNVLSYPTRPSKPKPNRQLKRGRDEPNANAAAAGGTGAASGTNSAAANAGGAAAAGSSTAGNASGAALQPPNAPHLSHSHSSHQLPSQQHPPLHHSHSANQLPNPIPHLLGFGAHNPQTSHKTNPPQQHQQQHQQQPQQMPHGNPSLHHSASAHVLPTIPISSGMQQRFAVHNNPGGGSNQPFDPSAAQTAKYRKVGDAQHG